MTALSPAPFQIEDMKALEDRVWSANWSEMGCYKTSTVCWLIPKWAEALEVERPKVLIITTRSGKGTYFKHVPNLLPKFEILNVHKSKIKLVLGDDELDYGMPADIDKHAIIFVAHYNVFSAPRKNKKKEAEEKQLTEELMNQELEEEMVMELYDKLLNTPDPTDKGPSIYDQLRKIKWDIIILDEAHRIKERNTGWTRQIKRLKGKVKHVMTGTGFINNPAEIYSLLHFLNKQEFTSYWRFRERYCHEEYNDDGNRVIVGVNPLRRDEFRQLVRTIGPRRTKVEVFPNLPHPIYSPIVVELNPVQREMYNSIVDELYALDQEGTPIYAPNVLAAKQRLRQIAVATPKVVHEEYDPVAERTIQTIKLFEPSSKLDAMMEVIEGLEWDDERKDQVVVFSNFKDPIELAKVRFAKKNIPYIELRQADSDRTRYEKWAIEFPKKEHQVFICTLQLGSESISLTSASTCIFLDRAWSPKDNDQGESRVWRPGQESVANIIYINAKETIDQRVHDVVSTKKRWFIDIFGVDNKEEAYV